MIKINLLPVRAAKRKEILRQQALLLAGGVILVSLLGFGAYSYYLVRVKSLSGEISQSKKELGQLKRKIGKIKDLEKLKESVAKKLDVLTRLRREKVGPVNRLLALSSVVPEKLWLTSYSESGTTIRAGGVAYTEELIADFMRKLESSPDFKDVELIVSQQIVQSGIKMKKFDLKFSIEAPKS